MKIFITGATGYIGSAVAHELSLNNHSIMALARSSESANKLEELGFTVIKGDILQPMGWIDLASKADVFIHCAQLRFGKRISSAWVKDAANADEIAFNGILQAARLNKNTKAIIYTSGISAAGDHGDKWIDENTSAKESFTVGSYHLKTEQIAKAAFNQGLPVVILRPSLPVSSSGTFASFFLAQASKGKLQFVGDGKNYCPTVHINDLADAYAKAVENPPVGETIIISDDNPLTMEEFSNTLMQQFGHKKAKSAPKWIVSLFAGKPLANLLVSSYRVKNDKAKKVLNWKPMYPTFKEALSNILKK